MHTHTSGSDDCVGNAGLPHGPLACILVVQDAAGVQLCRVAHSLFSITPATVIRSQPCPVYPSWPPPHTAPGLHAACSSFSDGDMQGDKSNV